MEWIRVNRWSSLKASKHEGKFAVMRGRPSGDNIGVISPEYTIKSSWQNTKIVPVKKEDGSWCVLPPGFSLGDNKAKALEIWDAIRDQIEKL